MLCESEQFDQTKFNLMFPSIRLTVYNGNTEIPNVSA